MGIRDSTPSSLTKEKGMESIRVAVRVRPPLDWEVNDGNAFTKIKIDKEAKLIKYVHSITSFLLSKYSTLFDDLYTLY